ncbi:hypothetical protein QFZ27_004484 [Inquilinus ginsengisoli]|uniref:hypothetical protein n=1 Tax=Inquilinus ginsengisoli TaxID=363840 RepID=UPI003D1BFAC5
MHQSLRTRMEAAVERLIAALDALDAPGEDLEPQGDDEAVDDRPCDEPLQDIEPPEFAA